MPISMKTFLTMTFILLAGCASKSPQEKEQTDPGQVVINPRSDLGNCKYIGLVEAKATDDWKKNFREQAGYMGATHIKTAGPAGVSGSYAGEVIQGNAYWCREEASANN